MPLALHRSAYNAAKAALNALHSEPPRGAARDVSPNIHVTLVMPGMVATEFARNALGARRRADLLGPHVQTVEQVADIVAHVIEHPVAEVYTNRVIRDGARYFADVRAFESSGANPWAAPV